MKNKGVLTRKKKKSTGRWVQRQLTVTYHLW